MTFKITVRAQAACTCCGKDIVLQEPIVSGELLETDKTPITKVFGENLANYKVLIRVGDATSCFVVDQEILCPDCHKEYKIAKSNIDLDAMNKKRKIIESIKKSKGG